MYVALQIAVHILSMPEAFLPPPAFQLTSLPYLQSVECHPALQLPVLLRRLHTGKPINSGCNFEIRTAILKPSPSLGDNNTKRKEMRNPGTNSVLLSMASVYTVYARQRFRINISRLKISLHQVNSSKPDIVDRVLKLLSCSSPSKGDATISQHTLSALRCKASNYLVMTGNSVQLVPTRYHKGPGAGADQHGCDTCYFRRPISRIYQIASLIGMHGRILAIHAYIVQPILDKTCSCCLA
jgi:hypothetical protein